MTINKDIEWIKEPLNFKESDSWGEYKKKLGEMLEKEFGIGEKELPESRISWLMEYIEKVIDKWKGRTMIETQKEDIKKQQGRIYKEILLKIKEKEWAEAMDKNIGGKELLLPLPKGRDSHSRSHSLPPKLNLNLTSEEEAEEKLTYKIVEEEYSQVATDSKEEKETSEQETQIQKLQTEKEKLEKISEELERKLRCLELEKKIEEIKNEIIDYKRLIEANFNVLQDLVKKGIIVANDETYLKNNQKIEKKINEYQEEANGLKSQLAGLKEQLETEAQIQIPPKT